MKILVIEDEKLLADSIKTLLEGKGFEVEVAYDGETGAEYAELGIYDLLILDVMMPKMDGFQGCPLRTASFPNTAARSGRKARTGSIPSLSSCPRHKYPGRHRRPGFVYSQIRNNFLRVLSASGTIIECEYGQCPPDEAHQ